MDHGKGDHGGQLNAHDAERSSCGWSSILGRIREEGTSQKVLVTAKRLAVGRTKGVRVRKRGGEEERTEKARLSPPLFAIERVRE